MSSPTSLSSGRKPTTCTIPDPASVEEHGRTFTAYRENKYYLPNDGDEQDRLDIQHKIWQICMKGDLYWAPIGNPKHVLDIATGTGIWAIHFARQHPQAHIVGTDLSLIQPVNRPPNCEFIRDDIEDQWIFQTVFDYIHLRTVFTCFDNPRAVLQKIYDNLAPGGWVEYQDSALEIVGIDADADAVIQASALARWARLLRAGLRNARGRDPDCTLKLKGWMAEIGFVDVVQKSVLWPINSWPLDPQDKQLGSFVRLDTEMVVDGSVKLLLAGGMAQEEVPEFQKAVKWNLGDGNMRGYHNPYVIYGRKPVGK